MAYVALHRLNLFIGDQHTATECGHALEDGGREKGVAPEWIEAIHDALARINPEAATVLPSLQTSEE